MPLIVEEGAGRADAGGYVALADVATYATENGLAWAPATDADGEGAIRRGTRAIDAKYRARFPGCPTNGRAQALEWPRRGAYTYTPDNGRAASTFDANTGSGFDQGYTYLPSNEVPREIKAATCEAAIRELAEPGSLAPDTKDGGAIRSLSAGSVSLTFAGAGLSGRGVFQAIDDALASLLMPANAYSGRVVRG